MLTVRSHRSGSRCLTVAILVLCLTAGCAEDDGATVRKLGGSATGDGSATEPGSATGIAAGDLATETDDELILAAVDGYRVYVREQIETLRADTADFADAVRAGDIELARSLYPVSRRSWERIEPIAGLIEDIDGAVDARADDGLDPEDPAFTGWHRLEYHLWVLEDVDGAETFADRLEADLADLAAAAEDLELPPGVLTVGAQELIEEVAAPDGKLSGEEDRYSGTDLYDFQANVEGAEALVELLGPALEVADPDLAADLAARFDELDAALARLGGFEQGFPHYDEVTSAQRAELAAILGGLAESLALLNGTLGLG